MIADVTRAKDKGAPTTVADVMRRDVVTISSGASIADLARLLRRAGVSGVPVVDDGVLVGTVSVTDVMWLGDARSLFVGDAADRAKAAKRLGERTVRDIMAAEVFGVGPDASLADLAAFFARTGLGRAIVRRDGQLLGIVSVTDLLSLIAEVPTLHAPTREG